MEMRATGADTYRSLMAYLRGEPKVWSVVRVPSFAEEDARRLHRERDRLISERVQHVNRIKGLCALHGIYDYQPLRPQAMARLEELRTALQEILARPTVLSAFGLSPPHNGAW
jgi:transposase